MTMPQIGELLVPVQAGPARGPRYARLLVSPGRGRLFELFTRKRARPG